MKTRKRSLLLLTLVAMVSLMVGCASEVDRLSEQLASPDSMVRWKAAEDLGKTKNPEAIDPLTKALEDAEPEVSNAAAEALGAIGKPAMPVLKARLRSPKADMRMLAIVGLTKLGDAESVRMIVGALRTDRIADVRAMAAWALGFIGSPAGTSALQAAAGDKNPEVRSEAKAALQAISAKEAEAKAKDEAARRKKLADDKKKREAALKKDAERRKNLLEAKKKSAAKSAAKKKIAPKAPAKK